LFQTALAPGLIANWQLAS